MTPGQIGAALSSAGILAMILQMTLFPWGHNKFGALVCLRTVLAIYVVLYFVWPSPGENGLTKVGAVSAETDHDGYV